MASKSIIPPDITELLKNTQYSTSSNINCIQIGKLEKVGDNQTCEIALQLQRTVPDATEGTKVVDMPILVDCPYFVLSGGKSYINMPIKKGDYCIVLFNDTNIDLWWKNEQVGTPLTQRIHDLSDGIALVGISPETQARTFDGEKVQIIGDGGVLVSGKSDAQASDIKGAARLDDEIKSESMDDTSFWKWVNDVTTNLISMGNVPAAPGKPPSPGLVITPPSSLTGKITSASDTVEIT